ncbi:hypothetical protein JW898_00815, partial [Candidatus Woesearchaeota archaeon]|nr:hypothetical protein [Candidatus Woesearchaeota archaeon]
LDGLTPRVQKMWDKLGKIPKKLEIKLLDAAAIDEEVKKAKEDRAKNDAAQEGKRAPVPDQQKQESAELTPDQVAQKEDEIKQLQGQINTALERKDKQMAKDLFAEITPMVERFPATKKAEWKPKIEQLKQSIG